MSNDVPVRSDRINSTNQCATALDARHGKCFFDQKPHRFDVFVTLTVSASLPSHNFPNTESHDSWHPFSSEGIEILIVISLLFSIPRAVVERSSAKHKIPANPDRDDRASPTAFFTAANKEHTILMGCSTLSTKFSLVFSLKKFSSKKITLFQGIVMEMSSHCSDTIVTRTSGCSFFHTSFRLRMMDDSPQ